MNRKLALSVLASVAVVGVWGIAAAQDSKTMTFFVTSVGSGKGADLGGIEGADRHCADLARAAGSNDKTWHRLSQCADR